jgi:hypothetical protein
VFVVPVLTKVSVVPVKAVSLLWPVVWVELLLEFVVRVSAVVLVPLGVLVPPVVVVGVVVEPVPWVFEETLVPVAVAVLTEVPEVLPVLPSVPVVPVV